MEFSSYGRRRRRAPGRARDALPQVSQLVIGGQIVEGDKDKDPDVLAEHLWTLTPGANRFRLQVNED